MGLDRAGSACYHWFSRLAAILVHPSFHDATLPLNLTIQSKQIRGVMLVHLAIVGCCALFSILFWRHQCGDTLQSCLAAQPLAKVVTFLILSAIRPFIFTPLLFVAILGGKAFGPIWGTLLTATGSVFSCLAVYYISRLFGKRYTKPWLRSNLPATFRFMQSQDYKLAFAARLVPLFPFDVMSFAFGILDFRRRSVIFATFLGALPEAYLFAKLVDPAESLSSTTLHTVGVIGGLVILPLLVYEFASRKNGTGMWQLLKAVAREINYEVHVNNDIIKRETFDASKTPVLLLYGFFSSRRSVTVLEKMLTARGHQVLSFNLGGLLGTFFTRDIVETANFIDYKIKRQMERHGYTKIQIVAHSKGGLVGLWWLLKQGGSQYCDTIITMGTPFCGTPLTYLALVTPLGFLWRDVGQMRPGSAFLRSLHHCAVPPTLRIHCLHSTLDFVAREQKGVFKPTPLEPSINSVAMNHISHFEFLYRRDVGDKVSNLLQEESLRSQTASAGAAIPLQAASI